MSVKFRTRPKGQAYTTREARATPARALLYPLGLPEPTLKRISEALILGDHSKHCHGLSVQSHSRVGGRTALRSKQKQEWKGRKEVLTGPWGWNTARAKKGDNSPGETHFLCAQVVYVCRIHPGPSLYTGSPLRSSTLPETPTKRLSHSTHHSAMPLRLPFRVTQPDNPSADRRETQEASKQAVHQNTPAGHRT